MTPKPSSDGVTAPRNRAGRFAHIDGLRAFAVLLVLFTHAGLTWVPGGSGVTIFFAISGFVITGILLRERSRTGQFDIKLFYARRFLKLFPPFVVATLIPTVIYGLFVHISWGAVLSQIFFVFNWVDIVWHPAIVPGTVLWSLAIEEQFYIIFALLWLALVKRPSAQPVVAVIGIAVIVTSNVLRFIMAFDPAAIESGRIYAGTDTRADGIAWGMLAALIFAAWERGAFESLKQVLTNDFVLAGTIALYFATVAIRDDYFRNTIHYTLQALVGALVVLWGFGARPTPIRRVFNKLVSFRLVQTIGLASYSIYLAHDPFIHLLVQVAAGAPQLVLVTASIVLGAALGVAIYYLVEVPVIRMRHSSEQKRAAIAQVSDRSPLSD